MCIRDSLSRPVYAQIKHALCLEEAGYNLVSEVTKYPMKRRTKVSRKDKRVENAVGLQDIIINRSKFRGMGIFKIFENIVYVLCMVHMYEGGYFRTSGRFSCLRIALPELRKMVKKIYVSKKTFGMCLAASCYFHMHLGISETTEGVPTRNYLSSHMMK